MKKVLRKWLALALTLAMCCTSFTSFAEEVGTPEAAIAAEISEETPDSAMTEGKEADTLVEDSASTDSAQEEIAESTKDELTDTIPEELSKDKEKAEEEADEISFEDQFERVQDYGDDFWADEFYGTWQIDTSKTTAENGISMKALLGSDYNGQNRMIFKQGGDFQFFVGAYSGGEGYYYYYVTEDDDYEIEYNIYDPYYGGFYGSIMIPIYINGVPYILQYCSDLNHLPSHNGYGYMLFWKRSPVETIKDLKLKPKLSNTTKGIKLSWEESYDADGYYIYRKTGSGSYSKIKTITSGYTTAYTDTSVKDKSGTKYAYYVKPYMGSTTSTSYTSSALLRLATITAKAANTSSGIKVSWSKVTGATGYYVYRKTGSGSFSKIKTITSGSTVAYTDTSISANNGTKYSYCVKAYNGKTVGAYVAVDLARLSGTSISSLTDAGGKRMQVKWTRDSSVDGYQIQYSTSSSFSSSTSVTISSNSTVSKTITGLTLGKKYYVRLRTYKTVDGTKYYSGWCTAKNVTVTKSTITYTIKFNANGGTGSVPSAIKKSGTSNSVVMGDITSTRPTREGYIFCGWSASTSWSSKRIAYSGSSGGGEAPDESYTLITSSSWTYKNYCTNTGGSTSGTTLTLYAQWYPISPYKIQFNANGGSGSVPSTIIRYGENSGTIMGDIESAVPTRAGYKFYGWSASPYWSEDRIAYSTSYGGETASDGTTAVITCVNYTWDYFDYCYYSGGSTSNKTLTLYAQWRRP